MYYAVSRLLIYSVEESLVRFAEQGAKVISTFLEGRISELEAISMNSIVRNSSLPLEKRLEELKSQLRPESYKRLSIADVNGNAATTDGAKLQVGDREYFKNAVNGISNVSGSLTSRVDGTRIIVFAVPITDGGKVTGVLYATYDADILNQMTSKIKINKNGGAFILDEEGNIIAGGNGGSISVSDNIIKKAEKDHSLDKLAALEKRMISGDRGWGNYMLDGVAKFMGYCPVGNTGWSIAVTAPESEVLGPLNIVFIILLITLFAAAILIAWILSNAKILKADLSRQQANSSRVADVTGLILIDINFDGEILKKNKYAQRFLERFEQPGGNGVRNVFELLSPGESAKLKEIIASSVLHKGNASFELSLQRDGCTPSYLYCSLTGDSELEGTLEIMGMDITDRVESQKKLQDSFDELTAVYDELAEKEEGLRRNYDELKKVQDRLKISENRYQLVIEGSNDAIWDWDVINDEFFYSDKFYEMTGYVQSGIKKGRRGIKTIIHPGDLDRIVRLFSEYVSGKSPTFQCEVRLRLAGGDCRWFMIKGKVVMDAAGKLVRAAGSITDINERKLQEETIQKLAYNDTLTGLPNRAAFCKEAGKVIAKYGESNKCALIYLDLDDFKYVKDSFSNSIGDLLLIEIVKRLASRLTGNEYISRLEGDEFAVFVRHFDTDKELELKIQAVMGAFEEPYNVAGNSFHITASCGISAFPEHAQDVDELLKSSNMAMYHAKRAGKHRYVIFEKAMNDEFVQRINMENGLREAMDNNEFILHYQPQYDLVSGTVTGFEALLRWMSPQFGLVPPLTFIGIAEETGLIVPIGRWVLRTACGFVKQLNDSLGTRLEIAVNISMIQLMQTDFVQMVSGVLRETGIEPELLELELTESRLMESVEQNLRKLAELQRLGVRISVDDFGKGFSSLSYLKQLPVNSIKIDKSFVDDIGKDRDCMIESLIHIGHMRGLTVIAEGVEKKEQIEYLLYCSCDKVQGYYYSKPVPGDDVGKLLQ